MWTPWWPKGSNRAVWTSLWEVTTFALVPQVVDAVSVPVLAAGGIGDGRGLAASLALGAVGVQVGTVFLGTEEAETAKAYKEALLMAGDADTHLVRMGRAAQRQINDDLRARVSENLQSEADRKDLEVDDISNIDWDETRQNDQGAPGHVRRPSGRSGARDRPGPGADQTNGRSGQSHLWPGQRPPGPA